MKFKIIAVAVFVSILFATFISNASRSNASNIPTNENIKTESKSQIFERIAREDPVIFKDDLDDPNATEWFHQPVNPNITKEELMGHINQEYGIREDILRYIEKEIPANNELAKKAAITLAQKMQFIYYGATEEEALKAARIESIARECLGHMLPDDWLKISRGIGDLMRNTPERDKYMWHIDETYFSWKILGTGISSTEKMKEICQSGNFEGNFE